MTGFGRASFTLPATAGGEARTVTAEIRAINSKQLDLRLALPNELQTFEPDLRRLVAATIERGKVDAVLLFAAADGEAATRLVNPRLFAAYLRELRALASTHNLSTNPDSLLRAVLAMPNIYQQHQPNTNNLTDDDTPDTVRTETLSALEAGFREAIERFRAFRSEEGAVIANDFRHRIALILTALDGIAPHEAERFVAVRSRLEQQLQEWAETTSRTIDMSRFEQEMLFYFERLDITEEKTRLRQNCAFFLQELADPTTTAKGRKLGFIVQEIGREVNTLGAKAYAAEIQRIVVGMKDELEKIKEQISNIL